MIIKNDFLNNTNIKCADISSPDSILFFDIETTGLSAKRSICYLIGCVYCEADRWQYIQWFANSPSEEVAVISAFADFCKNHTHIIHFNGDSFDIPFINERCKILGLCEPFAHIESIDLYKYARSLKNILKLENCRQKTIEQFLGLPRTDEYDGGELIKVYKDYVKNTSLENIMTANTALNTPICANTTAETSHALSLLLLHNHDDICSLPALTAIINYYSIFDKSLSHEELNYEEFNCESCEFISTLNYEGATIENAIFTITLPFVLPTAFSCQKDNFYLKAEKNLLKLSVPVYTGELKYFYRNYKDYYYLANEDTAIHKSVAAFVDKAHRSPAKANNCYTKKTGKFLPQLHETITPCFKMQYNDKISYFEVNHLQINNTDNSPFTLNAANNIKAADDKSPTAPNTHEYIKSIIDYFFL